jgi:hypothetical protein
MNSDFADSFIEIASSVKDPELSKYPQGAVAPSDSLVYEGEPPPLAGSVVFGLENVRSRRLKMLISALISSHSYTTAIQGP